MFAHRPLVIAHRGASSIAPENTLAAARAALDAGADMWEVDVTVTADHELIILHDDTLTRTTNVKELYPDRAPWSVADFTAREIASLDAGTWFVRTDPFGEIGRGHIPKETWQAYAGEHVPTLREVLLFTREHRWRINVELKALPPALKDFPLVDVVLQTIRALDMEERVVISSFVHSYLWEIREKAPRMAVAALVDCKGEIPVDWDTLAFPAYNLCAFRAPHEWIRKLQNAGRRVNIWVVNDEAWMRHFINQGVNGIFTDYPQRLSRLLRKSGP